MPATNNLQPVTNNSGSCYLVTGAAGFIAARVCEMLLAEGHTVVGIDNLNDYYDVRLKYYRLGQIARLAGIPEAEVIRWGLSVNSEGFSKPRTNNSQPITLKSDRFEFHTLDIEDLNGLDRLFAGRNFSAVFNLAARAGVRASLEHPELYYRTNVIGEENVLKCQVKHEVKKHVLASSSSVYAGCPMPFREDMELGKMQSPYAETKRQAELLAKDYHEKHGLDVTVLRYFTVYGPAGRPDMAPFRFVHWIATGHPIRLNGDGNQTRDFTYVDDIARGTILAARGKAEPGNLKPERESAQRREAAKIAGGLQVSGLSSQVSPSYAPAYEVINLGGGNRPITINKMIGILEALLGKRAIIDYQPASPLDMTDTRADIWEAGHVLGWKPEVSPEDGFEMTANWYTVNSSWISGVSI